MLTLLDEGYQLQTDGDQNVPSSKKNEFLTSFSWGFFLKKTVLQKYKKILL